MSRYGRSTIGHMGISPETVIRVGGYIGLFGAVFAESGLLIGFFLPGDSLLFTAGFFASQQLFGFEIWIVVVGSFIAAVAGDSVGYSFGSRVGKRIFRRKESLLFNPSHIDKARAFYEKHGAKTIVLARFVPVVRTFAPIVAGTAHMPYRSFLFFNVFGGLLWAVGLSLLGYTLGNVFPGLEHHLELVIVGIIVLSVLPALIHALRDPLQRQQLRLVGKALSGWISRSK
jgi:membrane-associated protein